VSPASTAEKRGGGAAAGEEGCAAGDVTGRGADVGPARRHHASKSEMKCGIGVFLLRRFEGKGCRSDPT